MKPDFEVGKFYRLHTGSSYDDRRMPALCTRILKRTIEFQYLYKDCLDDRCPISKVKVKRSYRPASETLPAVAYSNEPYSMVKSTYADMVADKPSKWDEI